MTISWRQIQAQDGGGGHDHNAASPCGRDIWGNSFVHGGALYLFGGAWEWYGLSQHWRDHGQLGVGNDLWRFDPVTERWALLEEDDWSLRYDEGARRPGARLLASFAVVGDYAYLFGGVTILERGFVLRALNDFWRYHVPTGCWEMIHPDTGWCNFVNRPSHPPIRGVHRAVAVGTDMYIFGGWPGTEPVFTVNDLWRYDTVTGSWEQRSPWRSREQGAGYGPGADYPGSRYCANLFAHGGALYLFSGRDTGEKNPEFFNDLWRYDPAADCWTLLHPDDRDADFSEGATYPAARYGSGHTVLGDCLYLFGGHSGIETGVERNDFWRYHVLTGFWERLHPDDGCADYGRGQRYPPVRRVSVLETLEDSLILFGGINCFMGDREMGYSLPLNDLWYCDFGSGLREAV